MKVQDLRITRFANLLGWTELGKYYIHSPSGDWSVWFLDRKNRDRHHDFTLQINELFENGTFAYAIVIFAMEFGLASGRYKLKITDDDQSVEAIAKKASPLLHRENFCTSASRKKYIDTFPEVELMSKYLSQTGFPPDLPLTNCDVDDSSLFFIPDLLGRLTSD